MTKKHLFIGIALCLLLCIVASLYFSYVPASTRTTSSIIHIPKSASISTIASILKEKKLIHSSHFFTWTLRITKADKKIRAGYFSIPKSISQQLLIYLLTTQSGKHNVIKVTIPEGFSISEIANRLDQLGVCNKQAFQTYAHTAAKKQFQEKYLFLNDIPLETIEGYLFPDTYFFSKDESIQTIISTMLKTFNQRIYMPYKKTPSSSPYSFHELLTLASLIQKESRYTDEMTTISSTFYNRLSRRMRLASDPTVVYALGKSYKDKVYYKDLKINSPYNTYKVRGFPPTPIASAGVDAFYAATHPVSTEFLFFVALPNGRHHFSKTYTEHLSVQRKKKR